MIGARVMLGLATAILAGGCALLLPSSVVDVEPEPTSAPTIDATQGPPRAVVVCSTWRLVVTDDEAVTAEMLDAAAHTVSRRFELLGMPEAVIQAVPPDQLAMALPPGDIETWRAALARPGVLTLVGVPPVFSSQVVDGDPLPPGMDPTPIVVFEHLTSVRPATDQLGDPTVDIELGEREAALFDAYAATHFGERIAIVLDGIVISAPSLNAREFNGRVQITGAFTEDDVSRLIELLRSGSLPGTLVELQTGPANQGSCDG